MNPLFGSVLVYFLCFSSPIFGAVKRSHEREEDGAYSPRKHGDEDDHSFDHEAILGTSKDVQEYKELSPEEAKKRLAVLVTKMDRNNDGFVESPELESWIVRSLTSLNTEEMTERMEEIDLNQDQIVSWEEYVTDEYEKSLVGMEEVLSKEDDESIEIARMYHDDEFLFKSADFDKSGGLDKTEFLAFLHPEDDKRMRPFVIESVLKEKDEDKDGKLSFAEFVRSRGKDWSKDRLAQENEHFNSTLDTNVNGFLEENEIGNWMIPSEEDLAVKEAEHLISESDDNGDGKLSSEEIVNHHDIFVGSEATVYGDHLQNIHKFTDEL